MAIEIVDFPIRNGGSFHSYVKLPEGSFPDSVCCIMLQPPYYHDYQGHVAWTLLTFTNQFAVVAWDHCWMKQLSGKNRQDVKIHVTNVCVNWFSSLPRICLMSLYFDTSWHLALLLELLFEWEWNPKPLHSLHSLHNFRAPKSIGSLPDWWFQHPWTNISHLEWNEICKVEETTNQLSVFPLHLEFWGIRPISTNIRRFQGPSLPAAGTPQHASPTSCRPFFMSMICWRWIWVCLKMVSTPKPNGFADHYPY